MKKVAAATVCHQYGKKQCLAVQDKTHIDSISVVIRGQLSLYDERSGKKQLTGYIKEGEVFGGITILLNGGISLRTVETDNDTECYAIPSDLFQDLCARNKAFYEYFLENFSKHIFDESLSSIIESGQTKLFIADIPPFNFLPEAEIDAVVKNFSVVHYPRGTVPFVQGRSRVGYFYILQKGSAERYYEENQQKTMRGMLSEGDTYGGISMLLNDGISVRTLQVIEESYFYVLPKQYFLDLCNRFEAFTEYFTDTFGRRMLDRSYASIIAKTLKPKEEALQVFNQPVESITSKKVITSPPSLTIQQAAESMRREKTSFLLVAPDQGKPIGIVTERDLAHKVIAAGFDISRSVGNIMSSPLQTIPRNAMVFEALMKMMDEDIRHLAVVDNADNVIGVVSNREFINAQGQSPLFLLREIIEADSMADIIDKQSQLPKLIHNLITNGANARNVTRFITTVSDAILSKIMGFTIKELGPPPVAFVFMTLGSEGRSEQTLKTDQDNAIIYADPAEDTAQAVAEYFLKFGEKACDRLDQAGYAYCQGGVMAKNPKWCQPLSVWKEYFSNWIHAGEAEDLLAASIFFDFRHGFGESKLIEALRRHLFGSLKGWSGFFRNMTENALHFKPPIGFFRNFVVESKGEHRNAFDIKRAIMPIIDFARIFALNNRIEETNTLDRLYQLWMKKVLTRQEYEELDKAYSFLMQLRFVRQVTAVIVEKTQPDNYINPKKLTAIEQTMLKEIFRRTEKFQAKLNFDFIGIA